MLFPLIEHIRQRAFELLHHRIQTPQDDGLLTPLQPENGGRRQSHFLGKLGERHVATLSSEELRQFLVQG